MRRIEDLAAEMRIAGLTLDDHMLYTIFIDALPAEYEVKARNLTRRDGIGRDDIIKAVRERHHRRSGNRNKRSNAGVAMLSSPVAAAAALVAAKNAAAAMATGKVETATTETLDVGETTDEVVKAPTRSVVARPRLPVAMAPAPKPPKVVTPR